MNLFIKVSDVILYSTFIMRILDRNFQVRECENGKWKFLLHKQFNKFIVIILMKRRRGHKDSWVILMTSKKFDDIESVNIYQSTLKSLLDSCRQIRIGFECRIGAYFVDKSENIKCCIGVSSLIWHEASLLYKQQNPFLDWFQESWSSTIKYQWKMSIEIWCWREKWAAWFKLIETFRQLIRFVTSDKRFLILKTFLKVMRIILTVWRIYDTDRM